MTVKILKIKGQSALIEWNDEDGNRNRGIVPADRLDDLGQSDLDMAISAGEPWAAIVEGVPITAEYVEQELYNKGIFTAGDLLENVGTVRAIIHGPMVAALIRAARTAHEGG